MTEKCLIPRCIEKILSASHCNVAYIGGSLTVGVGASNVAETCWRRLFTRYLYQEYHTRYHCQVSEIMGAIGASESYASAFMVPRNVIPHKPDLALVEFCVNDAGAPDEELVLKGMEGIVRQLLTTDNNCDVMLLGTGSRPGAKNADEEGRVDQSLHRQVAEHYQLPFVDMQDHLLQTIEERGETWDDVALEYEEKDPHHLNDRGQRISFEAIRNAFEQQVALFRAGEVKEPQTPLPDPMVSDELQHVEIFNPAKKKSGVELQGQWEEKQDELVPWYFDSLLMGSPGAELHFTFTGTAVAVWGLMYNNGLKVRATIDGEKVRGPYLRHFIEFGKGAVLAHGLPRGEHELHLTVDSPSRRHNKLEAPRAQIAYITVGGVPDEQ
ncbi:MAG: GDSL-type esterase/lipase family protein [Planctomycetota bacterium]